MSPDPSDQLSERSHVSTTALQCSQDAEIKSLTHWPFERWQGYHENLWCLTLYFESVRINTSSFVNRRRQTVFLAWLWLTVMATSYKPARKKMRRVYKKGDYQINFCYFWYKCSFHVIFVEWSLNHDVPPFHDAPFHNINGFCQKHLVWGFP